MHVRPHHVLFSSTRRTTVVAAVLAVLASYTVVGSVTAASGAVLAGSRFEIDDDANLTVDGSVTAGGVTTPNLDWLSPGALTKSRTDDSSGGSDSSFAEGTHEDDIVPTVGAGSIPPQKSDLLSFGLYEETSSAGTFLNVYWARVNNPNGDTNMDFEFNASPLRKNDPSTGQQVVPVRTPGDLLVTYDLTNGGSIADVNARFWEVGGGWGPQWTLGGAAIGRVNTSAIAAANSGGLGALSARTFGEASINLTALMPTATVGCRTYGSVYLKSRASQSFSATLKDFIPPLAADISNCGKVSVHKVDDVGTPVPLATFKLYLDQARTLPAAALPPATGALTCQTDGAGNCTISGVPAGTYWLHEEVTPGGYDTAADQQVVVKADSTLPVTFVDPRQMGTVTVTKDAVPDDGQDFTFALDTDSVTLDDDADPVRSNTKTWSVPVGSHTLAETDIPAGWALDSVSCTGSGGAVVTGASVAISLTKGQHVECTYTDAFTPLDAKLATTATSTGAGTWNDTATFTGDGTHPVLGTVRFYACDAHPTATPCATGTQVGTPQQVASSAGTYSATTDAAWTPSGAGWSCFRAVFTSTSAFYASSTHTNATSECFFKAAADLTVSKTALAAFGRRYSWTVDKTVDTASLQAPAGATATSRYSVSVAHSHVDSAWTVTGTITVTNPNPVPFTGVTVTDAIDNGAGSCAVTGGTGVTVPANGSVKLAYGCTYASVPSPLTGTNTARATWDAAALSTPHGAATGTASVDFGTVTPTTTDEVVTLDDSVVGALGTMDARSGANPRVLTYSVDRTPTAGTCTTYGNTARAVANDSGATTTDSQDVVLCSGADLTASVTGSAVKDRDHLWSIAKRVDSTRAEIAAGSTATYAYEVEVTPTGQVDSGFALTGTVSATNPNDWEAVTATLTVTTDLGATCSVTGGTGIAVPAGSSVTRGYSCAFTGTPPASGVVHGTVSWDAAAAHTPHSSASASSPETFGLGQETHGTVTVVDDKTDPAHPVTLGTRTWSDGPHTYRYSLSTAGTAGQCTSATNTASLTETAQSASTTTTTCVGLDLAVRKTALATDHRTYLWSISKDVDRTSADVAPGATAPFAYTVTATPAGVTRDGWSVSGEVVVSNPNAWRAVTATVTDVVDSGGGASCAVTGGSSVTVPASGSVTLPYSCTFTSAPADGTNTATATWSSFASPHTSATGTAAVVFVESSATNRTVTVVDDKTDPAHPVVLGQATWGSAPTTFSYPLSLVGTPGTGRSWTNTATITETGQSASRTVVVRSGAPLQLSGAGAGSFDRDHLWSLTKTVTPATATVAEGAKQAYAYTVTAVPGDVVDSGWALAGTLTLTNPNDWQAVTPVITLATDLAADATCTAAAPGALAAGASSVLAWSCAFVTPPATTGTVTATAVWDALAAATGSGSATTTVPVQLAQTTSGHDTVTVVDDQTDPGTLGTATWADGPKAFTYSLTRTATASCVSSTNTATLVETDQDATATSQLCGQAFTGGGGGVVVVPPVVTGGGGLPRTGGAFGLLTRWALAMLLGGAGLLVLGRRRQA